MSVVKRFFALPTCDLTTINMVNTCSVVNCKSNYKRSENKDVSIPEVSSVFTFPTNKPELKSSWIRFVNQKNWTPSRHCSICAKHFDTKYLKLEFALLFAGT